MKKTIITTLVAVAAMGFSGVSFAGYSDSGTDVDVSIVDLSDHITRTSTEMFTRIDNDTRIESDWEVEADFLAPAAGGNIGQVAYLAPAVGGDMIHLEADATAIQLGDVAPVYMPFALSSGDITATAGLGTPAFFGPAIPGGDATIFGATGAVTTGAITIDLSNSATALVVGGDYAPAVVTP